MSAQPSDTYPAPKHGWTCFHCGETFKVYVQARDHFGNTPLVRPACIVKADTGLLRRLRIAEAHADTLFDQKLALEPDAARWRYARQFLAIEDIEAWPVEMRGHQPSEEESAKADAAIDAAQRESSGRIIL